MGLQGRKRRQGQTIGKQEEQFAHELYNDGLSIREIAERTGISRAQIGRMKLAGAWGDDVTPPFVQSDITRFLDKYFFKRLLSLLRGEEEDETRAVLDLKNMAATKRDVEELIQAVDNRSLIIALQKHMEFLAKNAPGEQGALEQAQIHHDEVLKLL